MSYQDPPRRQRTSRYPAFANYEDGYSSYQDPQADYSSGNGYQDGYRGFAGLGGAPQQRAPWDDPREKSDWDTGAQRGTGAQRSLRDSGAQRAAWGAPAQQTEWDLRRTSGAFTAAGDDTLRAIADDARGRPQHAGGGARRRGRGLMAGAVAGFLAAAVALGVANLVAAFVRPQSSPIIAVGEAFIDRTPPALKNFAVQKFGENDKNMLLLGMYVTIALLAVFIGMIAWRHISVGFLGIGLFGAFGAFVAYTRPESRVTDVIPSVIGGAVGIIAIAVLARWASQRHRSDATAYYGPRHSAAGAGWAA